ncbi:hypothetical protein [Halotia branconii]|uniref:Uncharacterized protein n=1 Tax=Halotia branconii CENA392 TaxID=1539056 RepID=A0AAJ6P8J7_9CYAN|nr:hypothetical protein [Halotia branconii]WGV24765.1 hypothetical protein QI031_23825 [Halotia branconii CENA392]
MSARITLTPHINQAGARFTPKRTGEPITLGMLRLNKQTPHCWGAFLSQRRIPNV